MTSKVGRLVALTAAAALIGGLLGVAPAHAEETDVEPVETVETVTTPTEPEAADAEPEVTEPSDTPAQATEPDIGPPTITEVSATPTLVDLSGGDATLTVRTRIADSSGVKSPTYVTFSSRTTSQSQLKSLQLVEGTLEDGVWQAEFQIPAASARGAWRLNVVATDTLGNSRSAPQPDITVGPGGALQPQTPTITGQAVVDKTLTASSWGWGPGEVDLAWQWLRDGSEVAGATGTTYSLSALDLGAQISVRLSGSKPLFNSASRTSDPVTVQAARFNEDQSQEQHWVTVEGGNEVGSTLTLYPGTWLPEPVNLTYQWLRDGVPIPGATSLTYEQQAADVDTYVTAEVTGRKAGYTEESRSSYPHWMTRSGWLTFSDPQILGTWEVGQTLTVDPGEWGPGEVTFSYQWYRNDQPIAGATAPTYALTVNDAGRQTRVRVTGSKSGYSSTSLETGGYLEMGTLTPPTQATISGTPRLGQLLTVDTGVWVDGDVTVAYQWYRSSLIGAGTGGLISGATSRSYRLTIDDLNHRVWVIVQGSKPGYMSSGVSASVDVWPELLEYSTPELRGVMASGQTLTVDLGAWTPGTKFTYTWTRDGNTIPGATGSSYKLTNTDVGKEIRVSVVAEKPGFAPDRLTWRSAPAAKVARAATPKVSGTHAVGSTLKVAKGSWTAKTKFTYQWLRDGKPISKATKTSYKLTNADAGKTITARVTGKLSGYETVALTSAAGSKVTKWAKPKISGTKNVGKTLTAKPGSWSPGITFKYQWYANGKAIQSATGPTLKLAKAQKKKKISVKVTGSQSGFTTVAKTSAKTAKVK